jgi:hypothetical protein
MVTHLEREGDMEDWWSRNSSSFKKLEMEFDDHVCITTLPEDSNLRLAESKKKLTDLITRDRRWEAKGGGYYFGSPVQKPTPSVPPPKGGIWRSLFKVTDRGNDKGPNRRSSNSSGPSSLAPSATDSSYHTDIADSPAESMPPSPVVESPTPRSATSSITVPHIHTNLLGVNDPPQYSSGESMGSSLHSMFHTRYAIKTWLELLTYPIHEVLTVVTLQTLKCTWNLAQKRMEVCSQSPLKTMHPCCPCYRLLE